MFSRQVARRRAFLTAQLEKERATLKAIRGDSGPMTRVAAQMVSLTSHRFEAELAWLDELER